VGLHQHKELLECGAKKDRDWKPCIYRDAMEKIAQEKIKEKERWEHR
jgi:hypothetical protein